MYGRLTFSQCVRSRKAERDLEVVRVMAAVLLLANSCGEADDGCSNAPGQPLGQHPALIHVVKEATAVAEVHYDIDVVACEEDLPQSYHMRVL